MGCVNVTGLRATLAPPRAPARLVPRRPQDAVLAMDGTIVYPVPLVTELPPPPGLHWIQVPPLPDAPPKTQPVFGPTAWSHAGSGVATGFAIALAGAERVAEATVLPMRSLTMWFAGGTTSTGTADMSTPMRFNLNLTGVYAATGLADNNVDMLAPPSMRGVPPMQLDASWALGATPEGTLVLVQQQAPVQSLVAVTIGLPSTWADHNSIERQLCGLQLETVPEYAGSFLPDPVTGMVLQAAVIQRAAQVLPGPIDVRAGLAAPKEVVVWWTAALPDQLLRAAGIDTWHVANVLEPAQQTTVPLEHTSARLPLLVRRGVSQAQFAVTGVNAANNAVRTAVSTPSACLVVPKP